MPNSLRQDDWLTPLSLPRSSGSGFARHRMHAKSEARMSKPNASAPALFWHRDGYGASGVARLLTLDDHGCGEPTLFPSDPLQLGHGIVAFRVAETEIADEFPLSGNSDQLGHTRRVEDRGPAHADALGACG